jgi:hypothetical protein
MPRRRRTLVDVLFYICCKKFDSEGWSIKKEMTARVGTGKTLAHLDEEEMQVVMFPRVMGDGDPDPPLEMTLLHELIHIGLDLDGDYDGEGITYWLERYIWKRLTVEQKAILTKMLEEK